MIAVKFIIGSIILILAGMAVCFLIDKKNKFALGEKICLGVGLGTGFVSQMMLIFTFIGVKFNFCVINFILLIAAFYSVYYLFKNKPLVKLKKNTALWILLALIFLQIVFAAGIAIMQPVYSYDALANWAWKAKLFYLDHGVNLNPHSQYFMGIDHINYPLLVPFTGAWLYSFLGQVNDSVVNLFSVLFFAATVFLIFFNLKKYISSRYAGIFSVMLSSAPLFFYHASTFYADLILSFFLAASVIYAYNFLKSSYPGDLIICMLMSGLMVQIKNTGIFFALIILFLLGAALIYKKNWKTKSNAVAIGLFLLLALPWTIFKYVRDLGYSNSSAGGISLGHFHPETIPVFFNHLFSFSDFYFWFPALGLILIYFFINIRKYELAEIYLSFSFLAVMGSFFGLYIFTDSFQYILDGTLDGRQLLEVLPMSVFLAGIILGKPQKL